MNKHLCVWYYSPYRNIANMSSWKGRIGFWFGGPHWWCWGLSPGSVLRDLSWPCSGRFYVVPKIWPGLPHTTKHLASVLSLQPLQDILSVSKKVMIDKAMQLSCHSFCICHHRYQTALMDSNCDKTYSQFYSLSPSPQCPKPLDLTSNSSASHPIITIWCPRFC